MRIGATRQALGCALVVAAFGGAVGGCVSSPVAPPPPPSGGHNLSLSYDGFVATVEPALSRRGCDAGGDCHGGGIRGTFELSPQGAKDAHFDFQQCSMQVYPTMRDSSDLLRRPLADDAGGLPHPYKPFASTSDSDYVAIRSWIQAGVLQ
jgi:hypothetical protein